MKSIAFTTILICLGLQLAIGQETETGKTRGAVPGKAGFGNVPTTPPAAKPAAPVYHPPHAPAAKPHVPALPTSSSVMAGHLGPVSAAVNRDLIVGETGTISMRATKDLHLRVFLISADDKITQFYPNIHNPDTLIPFSKAHGKPLTIPFIAVANPGGQTGNEQFRIYVSDSPFHVNGKPVVEDGFEKYAKANVYSTRGGVALKAGFGPAPSATKPHKVVPQTYQPPAVKRDPKIFELKIAYHLKHY